MILRIFVLYVSYVIIAYPQSFKVLALFEYACSLSEIHNRLRISFFQKVVDFESSRVEQLLEKFLQLFDLRRSIFLSLGILWVLSGVGSSLDIGVLKFHISEFSEKKLQGSENEIAYFIWNSIW